MYLDLQSIFLQKEKEVIAIYLRTRKAPDSVPRTHRGEHESPRSEAEVQADVDRARLKFSLASPITQRPSVKNLKNLA